MAFEQELIEAYLSNTEEQLKAIELAVHEGNGEEIRRRAHSIKGSSANAGARGMQEIARRLEQVKIAEGLAPDLDVLAEVRSEFERVRRFLKAYVASLPPPRAGPAPKTPLSIN